MPDQSAIPKVPSCKTTGLAAPVGKLAPATASTPNLATELSYADFGKMQGGIPSDEGTITRLLSLRAERLAVLGIIPVSDNLEVCGKLSLKGNGLEGPNTSNAKAGVGFGASYAIDKNLPMRGECEYIPARYQAGDDAGLKTNGINRFKAGLSYLF
ncbi:hypothetical protein [Chromobacterium sphagni]|nr:hypothetical protein [Chromobacterium sphagni]